MSATPADLRERICAYYRETTESSYLKNWATESLAFHMGMDAETAPTHDDSLTNTNSFLADRARISAGTRVLDAGCGVGGSSMYLARTRGALATGISIEPRQIEIAQRIAEERGLSDRVEFHCMDFMATTFDESSFDVVWNIESLCYAHDVDAYLAHVTRLLRPGGRFACIDVFRGETGPVEHVEALSSGCVLPNLQSRNEVAAALTRAGFSNVESEDITPRILRCAATLHAMASRRLAMLSLEKLLYHKESPIYEGHTRGALGAVAGFRSGSVTYGYLGGVKPAH